MKVSGFIFVLVFRVVWAAEYQPILERISSGKSYCNSEKLLANFDLSNVIQFGALCNIPSPDIHQAEFLLENNVVPILCMGLYDITMRLCKSAEEDISRFNDIFPPSIDKFDKIFDKLINSEEYYSLGIFCSNTVKLHVLSEAAINVSMPWWNLLNQQLNNERNCTYICHTSEKNKVHPLCSYIVWSIGVFQNFEKNQAEAKATEGGQVSTLKESKEEIGNTSNQQIPPINISYNKNELLAPTESDVGSNSVTSENNKMPAIQSNVGKYNNVQLNSNVTSESNLPEIGYVKGGSTSEDQKSVSIGITNTHTNIPENEVKSVGKGEKASAHSKKNPIAITSKPSGSSKIENLGKIPVKPDILSNKIVSQIDLKTSKAVVSNKSEDIVNNTGSKAPHSSGTQKNIDQAKVKNPSSGFQSKPADSMVEGDFSVEVTPDGAALDQQITADKEFQPPYSDEEGEDGDGDDVDIMESNYPTNLGTNKTFGKKADSRKPGVQNVDQGALEGDKVYEGDGVIIEDHFIEAEDSHFFTYFLCMAVLTIMAYLAFHNKKKLIALAVEGRRTKGGRRRPNSSHYSKLDCSLEEALVSNTTASVTHVLY